MITDTMGIADTGLIYEGKLISAIKVEGSNLYECKYRWLYGTHTVFLTK